MPARKKVLEHRFVVIEKDDLGDLKHGILYDIVDFGTGDTPEKALQDAEAQGEMEEGTDYIVVKLTVGVVANLIEGASHHLEPI